MKPLTKLLPYAFPAIKGWAAWLHRYGLRQSSCHVLSSVAAMTFQKRPFQVDKGGGTGKPALLAVLDEVL